MNIFDLFEATKKINLDNSNSKKTNDLSKNLGSKKVSNNNNNSVNQKTTPDNTNINDINYSEIPKQDSPMQGEIEDDSHLKPVASQEKIGVDDLDAISKIYRLKKLFIKMSSLRDILQNYSSDEFKDVKEGLEEAIKIFKDVMLPNLTSYRDKLEDLIKSYEKMLEDFSKESKKLIDSLENKESK